jgi:GAF domain-containing protein
MPGLETMDELDQLAAGVARARGDGFFPAIAHCLASALHASRALVSETVDETHVHTLAVYADGAPLPNYPYALEGTPCQQVLAGDAVHHDAPQAGRPAYFGLPLHADDGLVLGHLCASDAVGLMVSPRSRLLCELLAAQAAAELQKRIAERHVDELERRLQLLEARNRHLEDELKLLEREQIAAAATGIHRAPAMAPTLDLDDNAVTGLHHVQREHILRVLNATRWVIEGNSGAALKLGMKPATLRHRMKKLGISRAQNLRTP